MIQDGVIRDESPLDLTPVFRRLCDACRVGDLKACHEALADGANINARDQFDYTPLILVINPMRRHVVTILLTMARQVFAVTTTSCSSSSNPAHSANEIPFKANDVYTMH